MTSKSKKDQQFVVVRRLIKKPVLIAIVALFTLCAVGVPIVRADSYQQQIDNLNAQNTKKQSNIDSLQVQASSYQQVIDQLQSKIAGLQAAIADNQAEQAEIQQQIAQAQVKLNQQKQILGDDIKAMYVDGQMTTVEELATSKDLSDFVDAETYRNAVQTQVQNTLTQISDLENQLKTKNAQVAQLISGQQTQQGQLDTTQQQQQQLLSYNQQQQQDYTQQIASNNSKIVSLEAAQAAANTQYLGVVGSGPNCGGGYPAKWCEVPKDSVLDNWGMYNRECVSYAAFRVYEAGDYMPGWGWSADGNANQWPGDAESSASQAAGISVSSQPQAGDVAIWVYASADGHAMYVEAVESDGSIVVSDYNYNDTGQYGAPRAISPSMYQADHFQFIHFPPR